LRGARQREQDRKLVIAQERAAFSRELHQSVAHDLFAIVLKARTALHHLDAHDARVNRELRHILAIAEGANRQLGYLIAELSTPDSDNQDFHEVLRETVGRLRRYYDLHVQCDGTGEAELAPRVHFALSRIVREALNNVVRHAHCQTVTISYVLSQTEVWLEIVDDGVGFEPARALRRQDKLGLRTMQDYARDLGCELDVESAPDQGTRIAVRFSPISSSEGSSTCVP
jgi:signal transduction histidine kinase